MTHKYIILGGSGMALEAITFLKDSHEAQGTQWHVTDVVSPAVPEMEKIEQILGYSPQVHADLGTALQNGTEKAAVIAVGDPGLRRKIAAEARSHGLSLATIIHPRAYVSDTATIGQGTIIAPSAYVGPFATVGTACLINVGASLAHDARMGDASVLSPLSSVNGFGEIGTCAFLGGSAVVNPTISLGKFGKLSAGSVLTASVGPGHLMHGLPAKGRQMFLVPDDGDTV